MATKRKFKSDAFEAIHSSACTVYRVGAIDKATMRNFDASCLIAPTKKAATAGEIAEMATRGENISGHFTNRFKVVRPIHRVTVDFTQGMLRALDARAASLNVSRQAVIKALLARALKER